MQTKICCNCKIEKPLTDYYKDKKLQLGVSCNCKKCYLIKAKIWKEKNKDKLKAQDKLRREKNKDEINKRKKEWRAQKMLDPVYAEQRRKRDRERFLIPEKKEHREQYTKQYWQEKKIEIREKKKKYREENPDYAKQLRLNSYARERGFKDYAELLIDREERKSKVKNKKLTPEEKELKRIEREKQKKITKENYLKKQRDLAKQKRIDDPQYKLTDNLRARIRKAMRCQWTGKQSNTAELLGMSGKEFYEYFLSLGYEKETDTIDHIVPISRFDLTIKEHQLVACHYLNLQPLHWQKNYSKHASLIDGWEEKLIQICKVRNINPEPIINYISLGAKC